MFIVMNLMSNDCCSLDTRFEKLQLCSGLHPNTEMSAPKTNQQAKRERQKTALLDEYRGCSFRHSHFGNVVLVFGRGSF